MPSSLDRGVVAAEVAEEEGEVGAVAVVVDAAEVEEELPDVEVEVEVAAGEEAAVVLAEVVGSGEAAEMPVEVVGNGAEVERTRIPLMPPRRVRMRAGRRVARTEVRHATPSTEFITLTQSSAEVDPETPETTDPEYEGEPEEEEPSQPAGDPRYTTVYYTIWPRATRAPKP